MIHRLRGAALCALFVVASLASAQGAAPVAASPFAVRGTAVTPVVVASPRATLTLGMRFENTGAQVVAFEPQVALPAGWALLVPPGEVRLGVGEARVVVFSVLLAADARAGTYVFPATYAPNQAGPRQDVTFEVRVPEVHRVELVYVEGPAYVVSERFTTRFLLRNDGNTPVTVRLTASSSASLPLALEPEIAVLEPGASIEVLVHATVSDRLVASTTHVLTLRAEHAELPDVQAVARGTSLLVPRQSSATAGLRTFPLTVRWSFDGNYDGAFRAGRPLLEVFGTGALGEHDPGRFTVRLVARLDRPLVPEEFVVSYRVADTGITVGDQAFTRSTLLPTEDGFGISAEWRGELAPGVGLAGVVAAYRTDTGPALAASGQATLGHGVSASGQLHLSSDGLIATVDTGYRAPVVDPTRPEIGHVDAGYAVRRAADEGSVGHAVRFGVLLRSGPNNVDLRYQARTAAFADEAFHRATTNVRAALRLNDALRVVPSAPIDLHLEYADELSWSAVDGAIEARAQTFGGALTARFGLASLSVSHREEVTREGTTVTRKATTGAQALVPIGGQASLRNRFAWIHARADGVGARIEYELAGSLPTGDAGVLNVGFDLGMDVATQAVDSVEFGAQWAQSLSPTWSVRAEADIDVLGLGDFVRVEAEGRMRLADERALAVGFELALTATRAARVAFSASYAMPLLVPIGVRSDVGTVAGSVHTFRGEPIEGVIVTVAGAMAATDAEGRFVLGAVVQGPQLVHLVPTTIPVAGAVITPAAPATIAVVAGETVEIAFEITPGAIVEGRLAPQPAAAVDDRAVLTPPDDAARWLSGAMVELTDGTRLVRTVTTAAGSFQFTHVPPGTWTLRVRHPNLPDAYRIEPSEVQLAVQAGEHERVEFLLVPVVRTIRFMDGGRLGGDD